MFPHGRPLDLFDTLETGLVEAVDARVQKVVVIWGFHSHGGTPNSWMVYFMENLKIKWMIAGGRLILVNLHVSKPPNIVCSKEYLIMMFDEEI